MFEYITGRSQVKHSSCINFTMKSMLCLYGQSNGGWIGDEMIFLSDIINLCTGSHHYDQLHPLPKQIVSELAAFYLCTCLSDLGKLRPSISIAKGILHKRTWYKFCNKHHQCF